MHPISPTILRTIASGGDCRLLAALANEMTLQLAPARIDTRLRLAHFLAQAACETWSYARLEEDLSYSADRIAEVWPRLAQRAAELANSPSALANAAYAGLNGNGNEASGDGWLFRGRGCLCLTGRANYATAATLCDQDFERDPDLVAQPHWAVATAIAFWRTRNIGAAADDNDVVRVTKLVTGSLIGLSDREALTARALKLLG